MGNCGAFFTLDDSTCTLGKGDCLDFAIVGESVLQLDVDLRLLAQCCFATKGAYVCYANSCPVQPGHALGSKDILVRGRQSLVDDVSASRVLGRRPFTRSHSSQNTNNKSILW